MTNLRNKQSINWPGDYPLALEAIKAAEKRREARRKAGHFQRHPIYVKYARSYKKGDTPGNPTGSPIMHPMDNRQERRRKAADHRRWSRKQHR